MRKTVVAVLLAVLACTPSEPAATPAPTVSFSPSPTPEPSPTPVVARFDAARAMRTVRALARLGPRETGSDTYWVAARLVGRRLRALGYTVRRQRFRVRAGTNDGIAVPAGSTFNLIAEPPGYRPGEDHLVVGGHLDTVPDSPGANDNGSGIAVMVELARLAAIAPPRLPVVFVAFGAEERRRGPGLNDYAVGSRTYLERMTAAERAAIRGAANIDMVGAGSRVNLEGQGGAYARAFAAGRRLDIPVAPISTRYYSDHVRFEERDVPVVWLWAGDHASLHTPSDVASVVQPAELSRVGRLAWALVRGYR